MSSRSRQVAAAAARVALRGTVDARLGMTTASKRRAAYARQARIAFERLGPAWIKLGQVMSVRPDILPPEWVFEMEALRDNVPPIGATVVRAVVRSEFGCDVDDLFDNFEDEPIASASIAQVHRARLKHAYRPVVGETLPAGARVAVKVVRPGVERSIVADVAAARGVLERFGRLGRWRGIDTSRLLEEFAAALHSETDLRNEAGVADRFAYDFSDDDCVIVPRVVWPLTTRRVHTMEYVEGWRLSDLDEAHRAGIDAKGLAIHGATAFLRQVLVHGRFHADLHPANLFVTPDSRICYLDFGIVGTTTPEQRYAIAQVLVATVYGDAERALRYSARLGLVIPPGEQARVRERIDALMRGTLAGQPRDVRAFALGFLGIMTDERIEIPEGYGLLVKALVTVEGVARALYPDVDIVEVAAPFVTELVAREALRPNAVARKLPEVAAAVVRTLLS